ncbi:MAG: hypothetical protein HC848_06115 [Limnobacter sp.]|nr:hypothetical protein [Limnobacter sp.]
MYFLGEKAALFAFKIVQVHYSFFGNFGIFAGLFFGGSCGQCLLRPDAFEVVAFALLAFGFAGFYGCLLCLVDSKKCAGSQLFCFKQPCFYCCVVSYFRAAMGAGRTGFNPGFA